MKTAVARRTRRGALVAAATIAGLMSTAGTSMGATAPESGAEAIGGSGVVSEADLAEQNTALDGRQNHACGTTSSLAYIPIIGETEADCTAADRSFGSGSPTTGAGARAVGGNGAAQQQNTAEQGRQNNACGNTNGTTISGGAYANCAAYDGSSGEDTLIRGAGARAIGGSGALDMVSLATEQNTAQEGRQNNACGNTNLGGIPGETYAGCKAHDGSSSKGTVTHHAGAEAIGDSGLVSPAQQNTAQEGRQNNACGNANVGSVSALGGAYADCTARDNSVSEGTVTHHAGAKAIGGSGLASLIQQNTAQEGRQNHSCGNTNGLSLDNGFSPDAGHMNTRCSTVDESTEVRGESEAEAGHEGEAGREARREGED